MKLSATVLTRLCVNITNLPGGRTRCVAGGSRPTESGNTPPADGAGYSEKGGGNHKKDPGISISHLNNREKTKIADALRQTYPLTELLHVLGLTRSSYFYHRAALKAGDKYATIRTMLTDIFNSNYQCYGYRRLHAMLRHEGRLSEKVVRRLMVEEQLVVSRNRRRRYSSYCGEIGPAPDNLIARDFKA